MSFQVHAKDLLGRIGTVRTKSGAFTTPHMFPVVDSSQLVLDSEFFERAGIGALMTNAYLLKRLRQGADPCDVHETLSFEGTVATDSGAYQILEYGKVGVDPDEIVHYQEKINTDIGVILDIPTGFRSDPTRARWTVNETLRRADEALSSMTRKDILWMGPVQGGVHLKEVERSAKEMGRRDFAIYALGSPTELMESQRYDILVNMILTAKKSLPSDKPFHLFGAGHPIIFPFLVALGCDMFDSAAYALYARVGRYLTSEGTQLLGDMVEFVCKCPACVDSSPAEVLKSAARARVLRLIRHNLWACMSELARIREAIRKGRLWDLLEARARVHPSLMDCLATVSRQSSLLEHYTPVVKTHGIFHTSTSSDDRPEMQRYRSRLPMSIIEKRKIVLLLPGRWRRPYHEDPRYAVITKSFDDDQRFSICYYSLPFGPVPIELDETFPLAQTESRDSEESAFIRFRAASVSEYVKAKLPSRVIVVCEGEYGRIVASGLFRALGKVKVVALDGEKLKPNAVIDSIKRKARVRA